MMKQLTSKNFFCRRVVNTLRCFSKSTKEDPLKDFTGDFPRAYDPAVVESIWYNWWEKEGFFSPRPKTKNGDASFSMVIPPPNVTGSLHLGHALTGVIEDAIARWNRMNGKSVLWVPGCDHAGIATQVVVEKILWQTKKKQRHDIGREEFLQEVWKWKKSKEDTIYDQLKALGFSLDWSQAMFTMDSSFAKAVTEAFVRLHEDGVIERREAMVNWCCHLRSTISDIEVNHMDVNGRTNIKVPGYESPVEVGLMTKFAYPVHDSASKEELIVATTRPETMLGDTAVAIHPNDSRYSSLHKKMLLHPFNGELIPIVCDEGVDMEFGTGAVKITPALDPKDYELAKRHQLPVKEIMDESGVMNENCYRFKGLNRFEAKKLVREALKNEGLYRGSVSHNMTLPLCSRSGDILEYRLKKQWFVRCSTLAQDAVKAVREKRLRITPETFEKTWIDWLSENRDWCISRQLWWGHRIPVYQIVDGGVSEEWVAGRTIEEARQNASKKLRIDPEKIVLKQDEDVLDTWFSSALFPFVAMGWPDKPLSEFYPLSLMETGHDILLFWVARMVLLGLKLTGELPFDKVLLHGIICDVHGRKMSKSLGNVVDPMDLIKGKSLETMQQQVKEAYALGLISIGEMKKVMDGQKKDFPNGIPHTSADAVRFALCIYDIKSHFINLDITKVKTYRLFCNKIWQAARFVLQTTGQEKLRSLNISKVQSSLSSTDLWILSRLAHLVKTCNESFESHNLHFATLGLYKFIYNEFCDVYLESVKPIVQSKTEDEAKKETTCIVLLTCLCNALLSLSPFMPFLTEELYQRLPATGKSRSITVAQYPTTQEWDSWLNPSLDERFEEIMDIVRGIRSMKLDYGLKRFSKVNIVVTDATTFSSLEGFTPTIKALLRCPPVNVTQEEINSVRTLRRRINDRVEVCLTVDESSIDAQREIQKLKVREGTLRKRLEKLVHTTAVGASEDMKKKFEAEEVTLQTELTRLISRIDTLKDLFVPSTTTKVS